MDYTWDVGDIVETELNGETVRGKIAKTNGREFIVEGVRNARHFTTIRTPNSAVNVTKGQKAELAYVRNVVGALNAYVDYWNAELQNSGGIHTTMSDVMVDLEHILEHGKNPYE